jgi:hypothetical protein
MSPEEWRATVLDALTEAVDQYVVSMAALLGITIEELAEKYELEYEPARMEMSEADINRDDVRMRVQQRVRLVRRKPEGAGE